jgi:hypothetical protein
MKKIDDALRELLFLRRDLIQKLVLKELDRIDQFLEDHGNLETEVVETDD